MNDRYEVQWREGKDDRWEPQVDFSSRWLANNYIENQALGGMYRTVALSTIGEGKERTQMASYPTCDECEEQHSQDVACEDVAERRMSEEQKQEYRLDQQDEAERGTPTSEFIDITPVGCQTPEGQLRVQVAHQEWDDATHALANTLKDIMDDDEKPSTDDIQQLRALIGARDRKQEAFLRAVAGK